LFEIGVGVVALVGEFMDKSKMKHEQISALADGELVDNHINVALAATRQPDGQEAWDVYHQIGDILRSDEMAVSLSPTFAARMAARLDAEPTIIAPAATLPPMVAETTRNDAVVSARGIRRFAMPGMIAAAVVAVAFTSAPQLMVAFQGTSSADKTSVQVAAAGSPSSQASASAAAQAAVVLRDPRIDEYMLAHQRFSPSLYSTAQFVRSATFATEAE
jgi:sigma-E factor negative regulatory protein RseA